MHNSQQECKEQSNSRLEFRPLGSHQANEEKKSMIYFCTAEYKKRKSSSSIHIVENDGHTVDSRRLTKTNATQPQLQMHKGQEGRIQGKARKKTRKNKRKGAFMFCYKAVKCSNTLHGQSSIEINSALPPDAAASIYIHTSQQECKEQK